MGHHRYAWMLALSATACCSVSTAAAAENAEYAVRWNPATGGPSSTAEVLSLLGLTAEKDKSYDVRYFEVKSLPGFPLTYKAIARERVGKGKAESMYKLRGPDGFPESTKALPWKDCPLQANVGKIDSKRELDISWVQEPPDDADAATREASPTVKKVHSVSCSVDAPMAVALPSSFFATQLGCMPHVERVTAGKLKVERWVLPDGSTLFEVSENAKDRSEDLQKFVNKVVTPLLTQGIRPVDESKYLIASSC